MIWGGKKRTITSRSFNDALRRKRAYKSSPHFRGVAIFSEIYEHNGTVTIGDYAERVI
jgi:hypothetical protein